jgi:membrane protein YdbS with pleckstrin-like domain
MKEDVKDIKGQVSQTIATLMTTAFGLIAALAWNEAIKAIILQYFQADSGITGLLIYAILITIIAVVATLVIARVIAKPSVQEVRIVE